MELIPEPKITRLRKSKNDWRGRCRFYGRRILLSLALPQGRWQVLELVQAELFPDHNFSRRVPTVG